MVRGDAVEDRRSEGPGVPPLRAPKHPGDDAEVGAGVDESKGTGGLPLSYEQKAAGVRSGSRAASRSRPRVQVIGPDQVRAGDHLILTVAPASSSSFLSFSASSFEMPVLMTFGAASTASLASFRPRPVAARTTLMMPIFLAAS